MYCLFLKNQNLNNIYYNTEGNMIASDINSWWVPVKHLTGAKCPLGVTSQAILL